MSLAQTGERRQQQLMTAQSLSGAGTLTDRRRHQHYHMDHRQWRVQRWHHRWESTATKNGKTTSFTWNVFDPDKPIGIKLPWWSDHMRQRQHSRSVSELVLSVPRGNKKSGSLRLPPL